LLYPAAPNFSIETVSGVKCRKPNVAHEKRPETRRKKEENKEKKTREIVGTGEKKKRKEQIPRKWEWKKLAGN